MNHGSKCNHLNNSVKQLSDSVPGSIYRDSNQIHDNFDLLFAYTFLNLRRFRRLRMWILRPVVS